MSVRMWVSFSNYFLICFTFFIDFGLFCITFLFILYLISVQYRRSFCSIRLILMYLVIFFLFFLSMSKYIDQKISSIADRFVSPERSKNDYSGLESHVLTCKHGGRGSKRQS